jgi:choline dehydrogenase-like flavoprotein
MSLLNGIIVGGGAMGCSNALRLRQADKKVTALERSILRTGTSSATVGILVPRYSADGKNTLIRWDPNGLAHERPHAATCFFVLERVLNQSNQARRPSICGRQPKSDEF